MRFSPKDFQFPETQQDILLNGTREDLIQWLQWNDRNGVWSDEDSATEGWKPMTLEQARACMRVSLGRSSGGREIKYSQSMNFNPRLPDNIDADGCKAWLRQLCHDFGVGFHPDTPASDYVNEEGLPLPPDVVSALDGSVRRAFEILGEEVLYTVCAEIAEVMLADLLDLSNSEHPTERPRSE